MIRCGAAVAIAILVALGWAGPAAARSRPIDLDVLFVGAHPDDEAGQLGAFGVWRERGLKGGVITITRGEGGGNAAGPEEGPALGALREREERSAVHHGGLIENVFDLDRVDFYYTVSAPLTQKVWGHDATLERVVRVIRATRPEVVITMDPSPAPGNHGNHQYAARMAVEAFGAAADPRRFPQQIRREGLKPWRVKRLFRTGVDGSAHPGRQCAASLRKADPTDTVGAAWPGPSRRAPGKTWSQLDGEAAGFYVSQGYSARPGSSNPSCLFFTQIASRVPFSPTRAASDVFEGARVRAPGGLPLGTELYLASASAELAAGTPVRVTAHVRLRHGRRGRVALALPNGWTGSGSGRIRGGRATFTVKPAAGAAPGRYALGATLRSRGARGFTRLAVPLDPAVTGRVERQPAVADFDRWAAGSGAPALAGLVKPVLSLGSGETRTIRVHLRNRSAERQSGTVSLALPPGFAASPATRAYSGLAPGARASVTFAVTNSDPSLPTADRGGTRGDYDTTVTTMSGAGSSRETFGLEIVPVTTVAQAPAAPTLDGAEGAGEYPGPALDLSRVWEGSPCGSPADCSATAKVAWSGDDLYVLVKVTDDVLGRKVAPADCKRHWRTDSVELAFDPRGSSENTSTTLKTGIFPATDDPAHGNPPCWERDADNHQGGAETAPGMRVVSKLSSPYRGYTLEARIPLADLPAAVDPQHLGMNLFVYDSDTQDLTGQTRLGWSTYGGVQGDPYRWGHAYLSGYAPPAGRAATAPPPVVPSTALASVDSPQSILQAAWDRAPLGGLPAASARVRILGSPRLTTAGLRVVLRAERAGRAHVFGWTEPRRKELTGAARPLAGDAVANLRPGRARAVTVPVARGDRAALRAHGVALVSFAAANGGTEARAEAVR